MCSLSVILFPCVGCMQSELSCFHAYLLQHFPETVYLDFAPLLHDQVRGSDDDAAEQRAISERAFSLLAQHFSIANPWQMAMANLTPEEIAAMARR